MQVKKVLFINTETAPYVAENTLSIMGKRIPETIQGSGCEIRTFMPKWGNINERRGQLHEVIRLSGMNIIINGTDHPLIIKVASIPVSRVQVYFIDNEDFFIHRGLERNADGQLCDDNGERAVFFARGVLETVKKLRWTPDVIHCVGWMASVVPFYIRKAYADEPCFQNVKIVSSLFDKDITGTIGEKFKNSLIFKNLSLEMLGKYNDDFDMHELQKLAVDYSDGIIEIAENKDEAMAAYIRQANIPMLPFPGNDFSDKYREFYSSL